MKIILDTNIIISALIRDSVTRKIIVESGWEFYYPEISLHEIRKYEDMILGKSGMSDLEYSGVFNKLIKYINLISEEEITPKISDARKELWHIDPDDVVFLAAAMIFENSVIWSNDKHFGEQNKVRVVTTENIMSMFFK